MPNGNQIEVDVRVDTSQARQAVSQLAADLERLKQQGTYLGAPQVTRVPGAPPPLPPTYPQFGGMTYSQWMVQQRMGGGGAGAGAGAAVAETGEAAERAGTRATTAFGGFERILERIAMRLIAIRLIFDAIAAMGALVKASMDWQTIEAQTKSFSSSIGEAQRKLQAFQDVARATGRSAEEAKELQQGFEMVGESEEQATKDMWMLEEASVVTGKSAAELQKNLEAVRLGTASTEQVQELAYYMDHGNEALREQLADIRQIEAELPRREQLENEIYKLQQRQVDEINRQQDAMAGFADSLGLGNAMVKQMGQGLSATGAVMHIIRGGVEVATANLGSVSAAMAPILRAGEQQLKNETGITTQALRTLEAYGLISGSELVGAQRRGQEEQRRKQEWAHEDTQWQRRWQITQALLQAQKQASADIEQGGQRAKQFADAQNTAAVAADRLQQSWKEIGQNMPAIADNLRKAADALRGAAEAISGALRTFNMAGTGAGGLGNLLTFMGTGGQFGRVGIPAPSAPGTPQPLQPSAAQQPAGGDQHSNLLQQILIVLGKTLGITEKVFTGS